MQKEAVLCLSLLTLYSIPIFFAIGKQELMQKIENQYKHYGLQLVYN